MKETEKAYLAGLLDGEGCIWSRYPKRKNVIVEISMTDKKTIEYIQSIFPGRLGSKALSGLSIKPQWKWSLDTNGSRAFLIEVMPYLITKKEEASIALRLCNREKGDDLLMLSEHLRLLHA